MFHQLNPICFQLNKGKWDFRSSPPSVPLCSDIVAGKCISCFQVSSVGYRWMSHLLASNLDNYFHQNPVLAGTSCIGLICFLLAISYHYPMISFSLMNSGSNEIIFWPSKKGKILSYYKKWFLDYYDINDFLLYIFDVLIETIGFLIS